MSNEDPQLKLPFKRTDSNPKSEPQIESMNRPTEPPRVDVPAYMLAGARHMELSQPKDTYYSEYDDD